MKSIVIYSLSLFIFAGFIYQVTEPIKPQPDPIATHIVTPPNEFWIEWDSPEGILRQERSQAKANMMKLLRFYESQSRPTYCGIATGVIALNALSLKPVSSKYYKKYRIFTQEEFFDDEIGDAVDKSIVEVEGLTLRDMVKLMKTQPLKIAAYKAPYHTDDEIRIALISALKNPSHSVIVHYERTELKQEGSGHWSPLAAYDLESDSFLVLDVARYKYPPAWISADTLIASMKTFDTGSRPRGFLVLDNKMD